MEHLTKIVVVGVGGAFGAIVRYLISISSLSNLFHKFPFPTFLTNVIGSFLIGFLMIFLTEKFAASDNLRLLIIVGFVGAFTTFSTFELEIFELIRDKLLFAASTYLLLSVLVGFLGVASGILLAKKIL